MEKIKISFGKGPAKEEDGSDVAKEDYHNGYGSDISKKLMEVKSEIQAGNMKIALSLLDACIRVNEEEESGEDSSPDKRLENLLSAMAQ